MAKLLWTTHNDLSLPYFTNWDIHFYEEYAPPLTAPPADLVYFRDPFNSSSYQPSTAQLDPLLSQYASTPSIDQIHSFQDMLDLEDKYHQAQVFSDLMPPTSLATQQVFTSGQHLAKPRISQRAKDILFQLDDRQLDDHWIIQDLLDIREELRVYVTKGNIIHPASIKSSKLSGKVKVIGTRDLAPEEVEFVSLAVARAPQLDFIGLDIAVTPDGLKIIECNRSPQFKRFIELTGVSPIENL